MRILLYRRACIYIYIYIYIHACVETPGAAVLVISAGVPKTPSRSWLVEGAPSCDRAQSKGFPEKFEDLLKVLAVTENSVPQGFDFVEGSS